MMSGKVAELYAEFSLDTTKLKAGVRDAKQDFRGLADEVTRQGHNLGDTRGKLDDYIGRLKNATPENARFALSISKVTDAYERGAISGAEAKRQLEGIRKEMDRAEYQSKSFKDKFSLAFQGVAKAAAGIGIGVVAVRKLVEEVYNLGKAGAQLDYSREKFDKLAMSIGETGDILLGKLRASTKGLVADSDLVASATDMMALGFAKTSDQAVRLTRVAGALNMPMNQLVLALANRTTARFDQLNVAVDGFDERLSKLRASGLSVSDAFTEAFLQQAEAQIEKVGETADSAVASYARLEAAAKNLGDAFKVRVAPGITSATTAAYDLLTMNERLNQITQQHGEEVAITSTNYEEYRKELERAAGASGLIVKETDDGIKVYENHLFKLKDVTNQVKVMTEAEWEEYRAAKAMAELHASFTEGDQLEAWALRSAQGMDALSGSVDDGLKKWLEYRQRLEDVKQTQLDINLATIDLKEAQVEYGKSVGEDVAQSLEQAGVKGDKYREALSIIDQTMGTQLGVQKDYNDAVDDLAKKYSQGKISGDEFKQGLQDIKSEFEPFEEKIRAINDRLFYLNLQLDRLADKEVNVKVNYTESGPVPGSSSNPSANNGSGGEIDTGGGSDGGKGLEKKAAGGDFVIPARYGNEGFNMGGMASASSGEVVSVSNSFTINQQPGQSAQEVAQLVMLYIGATVSRSARSGRGIQGA